MIWIWAICADLGFRPRSSGRPSRHQLTRLSGGLLLFCMPLCVYESHQWENRGFSTHKGKSELFLNTRPSSPCLSQPYALSLLQLPLPTGHWLFDYFHLLSLLWVLLLCSLHVVILFLLPGQTYPYPPLLILSPLPNPGQSSLEYMTHFNFFFSFTGPSSGSFSLMTPVWLRLCSSMIPISTLILALTFDLFEYKDYMLDLHLLYSDLRDVNTQ